jgi:hypothetical protein
MTSGSLPRPPSRWRAAVLWAWTAALPTAGHDFTITEALAVFKPDGLYHIDMQIDLDALALGEPSTTDSAALAERIRALPAAERGRLIADLIELLRRRVRIRFDGGNHAPHVAFPEYDALLAEAAPIPSVLGLTARLSGRVPDGAREFTLWVSRAFPPVRLTLFDAGSGRVVRQMLGSGEESAPFLLRADDGPRSATQPATDSGAVHAAPAWLIVAVVYLKLGFEHIVPRGVDHVLFVLGLFLLSAAWRPLVWQVTAFTLAHSITLALAIYEVVALPARVVEPLIAASIAYVAIENLVTRRLHWWRPVVVFVFGLLHGLGFAGVLHELGLPRAEFVPALVGFNVGVELGQLAVIGTAALLIGGFRRSANYRRFIVIPASLAIACVGLYWAIERAL